MQVQLKTFQQQLLTLFTHQQERKQFLQSPATEYATYKNIEALPKKSVAVYAGLLTSTADGTMSSIFPAVRTFYNDTQWLDLLEQYFANHKQSNYRLNAIAQDFSQYLTTVASEKSWLSEVADYEYQELAAEENILEIQNFEFIPLQSQTEIISFCPVLNPTFCLRSYSFDVAEATTSILDGNDFLLPPSPENTKIVFFRDPKTHRCRQLKLGELAQSMLLEAVNGPFTYAQILQKCLVANQSQENTPVEEQLSKMLEIFNDFHSVNLFSGNFTNV